METFHDEVAEEGGGGGTVRGREGGELGFAEGEGKGAAIGQFAGVGEQFGVGGEELLHFSWGTEMVFALRALFGVGLAEEGEGADALDYVVLPAVGGEGVVDGEGGDGGIFDF